VIVAYVLALFTGISKGLKKAIFYPYTWGGGRTAKPSTVREALGLLAAGSDCSGALGVIIWLMTGRWVPNTVAGFQASLQPLASYQGETGCVGFVHDSTGKGYHAELIVARASTGYVLTLASAGGGNGDIGLIDHNTGFGLRLRPESWFNSFALIPVGSSPLVVGATASAAASGTLAGSVSAPSTSAGAGAGAAVGSDSAAVTSPPDSAGSGAGSALRDTSQLRHKLK